ncbi:hypothetical protein TNIN_51261, partial [Trichonephila inaurata madagascariensis]
MVNGKDKQNDCDVRREFTPGRSLYGKKPFPFGALPL